MNARLLLASIALTFTASIAAAQDKLPADVAQAVKDNNRFALELYGNLAAKDGNFFYSPYSISTALAMTYEGARGRTAEEMAKTLHYTLPNERLHSAFAALIKEQNDTKNRKYKLNVANRLWGQKEFGFLPDFLGVAKNHYGAGLEELDFIKASEPSRKTINDWIAKETQDKIKDLIPEGAIDPDTRLVLTNAIYFKASWMESFSEQMTKKGKFFVTEDKSVEAMMMQRKDDFSFFDSDTLQILEMPYENRDLSMIVILPKRKDNFKNIETTITVANLADWLKQVKPHTVDVKLPRFKFTSEFKLKDTLSKMGMPTAFTIGKADLSGMAGSGKLFISDVIHKAFVDVHEKGTEAAAATAVIAKNTSLPPPLPKATFHADHPFAFMIRDNCNGAILFAGRVAEPKQ